MVDIIGLLLYTLPIKSQEVSMFTKLNLLEILNNNTTSLSIRAGSGRQAGPFKKFIWKAIKTLQNEGFEIDSKVGSAYRLLKKNDVLSLHISEMLWQE